MVSQFFSTETLQTQRKWHDIIKVLKGSNWQPRIVDLVMLSLGTIGEIEFSREAKVEGVHDH